MTRHVPKIDPPPEPRQPRDQVAVAVRVNYSETDQMGVVYHARYVVWLDVARTEYLRQNGLAYKDLEARGFRLVVSTLHVEYRRPARYDDVVIVRCWVRERRSRRVTFAYQLVRRDDGVVLGVAETPMLVLDATFHPTRLPDDVAALLPERPAGVADLTEMPEVITFPAATNL